MNHVRTAALGCPASAARRARKLLLSVGGTPTFTFCKAGDSSCGVTIFILPSTPLMPSWCWRWLHTRPAYCALQRKAVTPTLPSSTFTNVKVGLPSKLFQH
jgi:hypothetical protein